MKCPYCSSQNTSVIDSRPVDDNAIRRRRQCDDCKKRFTTYERVESIELVVRKKDGTLEPYDKNKIRQGIVYSCVKRPISKESIDKLISEIEEEIMVFANKTEIESQKIGEIVLEKLRTLDKVAYIRFASVYRDFREVSNFKEEVANINK